MKRILFLRSIIIAVLTGTVLAISIPVGAASFTQRLGKADHYVPDEVLVKFNPTTSARQRTATVEARGHALFASLNQPGWVQVKIKPGQTVEAALATYQNDPNVEYAQPNYIYHATATPNDTQFGQLWAFKNTGQTVNSITQGEGSIYPTDNPGTSGDDINIEPAWDHITDCSSVVVAVIDSGVNYTQEDLVGNMWNGGATYPNHGWNYVDGNNDPMDLNGHGTHVAGIIGAMGNNSIGTTGVCWKASIMAVRVLEATGKGTTANIIQGINFAVSNGAKVINMSLGGISAFDQAFSDSITAAQNGDVVVVVAAGNDGANIDSGSSPFYPCSFNQSNLICVAALDQSYQLATFSNYGSTSVDVGAPGTNILSTYAGSSVTISDNLNTGWMGSGGGWAYSIFAGQNMLCDPATFPLGTYSNNADNRVYKTFNLSGINVAVLNFSTEFTILQNDFLNLNYQSNGGDPFASGVLLASATNETTNLQFLPYTYDLSPCISPTCSVGFQLLTGASGGAMGVGIVGFSIDTLTINSSNYNTMNGTSMASPQVAGLATMLRAYNPQYTYSDVANAIKNGGRGAISLAGKTTTGNAIDVMSSLAYINPPTGLTATLK
jgi:subtilisin family serine protease